MAEDQIPKGRLFTHTYLNRNQPVQDSQQFRKRIGFLFDSNWSDGRMALVNFLKLEMGLNVPLLRTRYSIELFLEDIKIEYLLNAITLIWRFLKNSDDVYHKQNFAGIWHREVSRALKEENLCYRLDEKCGVHFLIDEEFETNVNSTLHCLGDTKYSGSRKTLKHAYDELTSTPPHTKDAIRAIFESIEILVKKMVKTKNLNKWVVQNTLKDIALEIYSHDPTSKDSVEKFFMGFGDWVEANHNYRHGQDVPEPTDPPIELAIYILSSGASFLRWLVEIDMARNSKINQ